LNAVELIDQEDSDTFAGNLDYPSEYTLPLTTLRVLQPAGEMLVSFSPHVESDAIVDCTIATAFPSDLNIAVALLGRCTVSTSAGTPWISTNERRHREHPGSARAITIGILLLKRRRIGGNQWELAGERRRGRPTRPVLLRRWPTAAK
jgi:hypothetical protein